MYLCNGDSGRKRIIISHIAYFSVISQEYRSLSGSRARTILCPSNGGIGIRLKVIRDRLMITNTYTNDSTVSDASFKNML